MKQLNVMPENHLSEIYLDRTTDTYFGGGEGTEECRLEVAPAADRRRSRASDRLGGRVASMIADELFEADRIAGLLCVGYPFHPIGKPEKLRTEHLKELRTPTLICQGTRDQFGSMEEVSQYDLSSAIQMSWFEDGDHDLKPRKRVSGFTHADHIQSMGGAVSAWVDGLVG